MIRKRFLKQLTDTGSRRNFSANGAEDVTPRGGEGGGEERKGGSQG